MTSSSSGVSPSKEFSSNGYLSGGGEVLAPYNDIGFEQALGRLADIATRLFGAPVVLVSFADGKRWWFASEADFKERAPGPEEPFCAFVLETEEVTVVEDLREAERFAGNPYVTEEGLRSYAGAPLPAPTGPPIGAFCLLGREPRAYSAEQQRQLSELASMVVKELEHARETARRKRAETRLQESQKRYESLFQGAGEAILVHDAEGRITDANDQAHALFGHPEGGLLGTTLFDLHPAETQEVPRNKLRALRRGERYGVATQYLRADGSRFWGHLTATAVEVGSERLMRSMIRDVTERRRTERLQRVQSLLFEEMASGVALQAVLSRLTRFAEEELPGGRALALRSLGERLLVAAAPSVPEDLTDRIDGAKIASSTGPLGAAASENRLAVATDLQTAPRGGWHEAAAEVGAGALWAVPIPGEGQVLGAFGALVPEPRAPTPEEKGLLRRLAQVVGIAIEKERREDVLQSIFDDVPVMIGLFDEEGTYQLINQQVEKALGWSQEDLTQDQGLLATFLPDPDARSEARRFLREAPETWKEFSVEAKGGKEVPVLTTVSRLNDRRRIAIGLDVSQRKEREEKLRLLEAALEHSKVPVLITEAQPLDRPGPRITYSNPAFAEISGYTREEARGKSPRFLQGEDTDRAALNRIREALENEEPIREVVLNYTKEGERYWNDIYVAPVRNEAGEVTHFVSIQDDVTEQVRQRERLEKAKQSAEQAARLKSALLSNMNHEFRTPLTSIISFSEILERSPEHAEQFAGQIKRGGIRLLRTLNTVMDFAELEGGNLSFTPQAIDLGDVVAEVTSGFREKAERKALRLRVDRPDGAVIAVLDPHYVRRICMHLISNALKFTDEGRVTVKVRAVEGAPVLWVEDTGVGIPSDFQPKVFEEFAQASSGLNRTHEGNGLGLTIVKRIVDRMGGSIALESTPGEGTQVRVRFPTPGGT